MTNTNVMPVENIMECVFISFMKFSVIVSAF